MTDHMPEIDKNVVEIVLPTGQFARIDPLTLGAWCFALVDPHNVYVRLAHALCSLDGVKYTLIEWGNMRLEHIAPVLEHLVKQVTIAFQHNKRN